MDEIRSRYVAGGRDHLTNVTMEALARGDRYAETELGVVWPDGSRHWLLLRAHLHVDEEDRATGAVGVVLDISERKEAAERIRFQAHLLDAVDEAVIATDLQGTIIFWNRFAERLYGWPAAEAMGRSVVELTSRSDPARIEETMRHLAQGGSWSGRFTATHRDGSTFPAHVSDAPIFDEAGRQVGIVGISFDITDRIRWEEHQKLLINELNHRVKNTPGDGPVDRQPEPAHVPDAAGRPRGDRAAPRGPFPRPRRAHPRELGGGRSSRDRAAGDRAAREREASTGSTCRVMTSGCRPASRWHSPWRSRNSSRMRSSTGRCRTRRDASGSPGP